MSDGSRVKIEGSRGESPHNSEVIDPRRHVRLGVQGFLGGSISRLGFGAVIGKTCVSDRARFRGRRQMSHVIQEKPSTFYIAFFLSCIFYGTSIGLESLRCTQFIFCFTLVGEVHKISLNPEQKPRASRP